MITDIKVTRTMDISKENDTYNISEDKLPYNVKIAASSWIASSVKNHFNARLSVLSLIFKLLVVKVPNYKLWCLVGDSVWQDDTRIIRHKKLFKRLKSRGVEINHSAKFIEYMKEDQGKLKFFGASLLSEESIESVVKMIAEESCCYLIAAADVSTIELAIYTGWEAGDFIDRNLLNYIAENNVLVFKVVGKFDDPDSGFVGLGAPELLKKLG